MTRKIYLYAGYYELYITDKQLNRSYTLISTHRTVANAERAAEKFDNDAWLMVDRDLVNESMYSILYDSDDYYLHTFVNEGGSVMTEEIPAA